MIWRGYYDSHKIDPRKPADKHKPYKASTNTHFSTQAVLDPRKGRLKSFWHGLNDDEKKKYCDINVGQVMASVASQGAGNEKVCYALVFISLIHKSIRWITSKC